MLRTEPLQRPAPVLFLILVALLILAIAFQGLPMTQHALNQHQGQQWDAVSISSYFDSGKCIPQEYSCMAGDFDVFYCELSPGKAIGLVIGRTVRQIVTGFAASTGYWKSRCGH